MALLPIAGELWNQLMALAAPVEPFSWYEGDFQLWELGLPQLPQGPVAQVPPPSVVVTDRVVVETRGAPQCHPIRQGRKGQ
jgi:hypothetical protein